MISQIFTRSSEVLASGKSDAGALKTELDKRLGKITGDTTSVLLYTSGTTGRSKGVVQTHKAINWRFFRCK